MDEHWTRLAAYLCRPFEKPGRRSGMPVANSSRVGGKVAIVTGAGLNERGLNIGGATARILASEGARVLVATRTGRDGDALAELIRSEGGEVVACTFDQGEEASIRAMIGAARLRCRSSC